MAIRPATFDPLDAPLWEGHKYFQELADVTRATQYQHTFRVDPKHWQRHKPAHWVFKLQWQTYRYSKVDSPSMLRTIVPQDVPGVYMFSVRPAAFITGFPNYVLYVGISNANDSGRPVRKRLEEYLPSRISAIKKRSNIHRMACLYLPNLWVHFAYVNKSSSVLRKTEKKLHGYLAPPVADEAYPIDMKKLKPMF